MLNNRYIRNIGTFTQDEQMALFDKKVLVVGCGGLGGFVIESLARIGIKDISIIDGGIFVDNNLNRQILSIEKNIGNSKVLEAQKRIREIDSTISVSAYNSYFDESYQNFMFNEFDIVIECIDDIKLRILLEKYCIVNKVPLIHGAIDGEQGQVACIDKKPLLEILYKDFDGKRVNSTPFYTIAAIGAMQISLAVKRLLNKAVKTRGFYYCDLKNFNMQYMPIDD
ncbi:MAG: ThiF family adenylyltransferase [Bacilli bacterium]|nr:ThiF family adenylyltransferase [Bacilli bacterium]